MRDEFKDIRVLSFSDQSVNCDCERKRKEQKEDEKFNFLQRMQQQILQSTWELPNCSGAPSMMFVVPKQNATALQTYANSLNSLDPQACGLLEKHYGSGCCYTTMENNYFGELNPYQSVSTSDSTAGIWSAAVGHSYCYLIDLNPQNTWLKPYAPSTELYLRANDQCNNNHMKCTSDGYLEIYSSANCAGLKKSYRLSEILQTSLSFIGAYNVSLTSIPQGSVSLQWIAQIPHNLIAPSNIYSTYYLGTGFYILSIIGSLIVLFSYSYHLYKGRTKFMMAYVFSHLVWLIYVCVSMYYCYTTSSDFYFMTNLYQANQVLFALATLFTVLISSSMLLIFMRVNTKLNFSLMILIVLVLHIGFCAPLYGYNFITSSGIISSEAMSTWTNLQVIWVVAMYFIDLSPHVFVFGELLKALPKARKRATLFAMVRRVLRYDSFMVTLLFLQILNACWYMSLFYFTNLSSVLQSDENLLNMQGLIAFSYIFHAVLSCLLNQHLRELLAGNRSFNITASSGSNIYKPQRPPLIQTTYVESYDYPYGSIQEPDQAYSPSPLSETSEISSVISEGSYIVHPITNVVPERKIAPNLRIDVTRLSLLDRRSVGSAKILTAEPLLTSPILEALARNSNDHRPQSTYSLLFQQTKDEHERNSTLLSRTSIETPLSARPRSYYFQPDATERNTPSRNGHGPQTYF